MDANFKTCMFGGFDKQSVVAYIEKQSQQHREALMTLEKANAALNEALADTRTERDALAEKAGKYDDLSAKSLEMANRLERLSQQLKEALAESETLRGPAEEYTKVKDHIAEIEISAHRRTEEFRAKAIAELRGLIENQRRWCGEERARYEELNSTMRDNLSRARDAIGEDGGASFDAMIAGLQELEESLK